MYRPLPPVGRTRRKSFVGSGRVRLEPARRQGSSGQVAAAANAQPAAADPPGEIDTEATIWTVLGLAKKPSEHEPGPQTGNTVSPILWQAAHDTLNFVKFSSEDPLTGLLVTNWYSPRDKPDERYKISVFVLSRELRSEFGRGDGGSPGALADRRVGPDHDRPQGRG